jgi:hypothetical protein
MQLIYSDQKIPKKITDASMFLAGPTPRDLSTPSWRPEALKILTELKYTGTVFMPERKVPKEHIDYDAQVEWEDEGLHASKYIVFWIPRDLETLPAFTTNVEFGRFVEDNRTLYGRPPTAPKNRYLDWLYKKYNGRPIYNTLMDLLQKAVK